MNNTKIRPRMSIIELRMILSDMGKSDYDYNSLNKVSHSELMERLRKYLLRRKL
jgi:hypothetical protein